MEIKTNTWWEAQNTGWSVGVSWFKTADVHFTTKEEATAFNRSCMRGFTNPDTKWRVVKITLIEESYLMEATE